MSSVLGGIPTGLPSPTGIPGSIPVSVPPLPATGSLPIGAAGVLIPGLSTDPVTLLNNIAEALQLLGFIASLLQQLAATGAIGVPGVPGVGLSAEGALITTLLGLVKGLIPLN